MNKELNIKPIEEDIDRWMKERSGYGLYSEEPSLVLSHADSLLTEVKRLRGELKTAEQGARQ